MRIRNMILCCVLLLNSGCATALMTSRYYAPSGTGVQRSTYKDCHAAKWFGKGNRGVMQTDGFSADVLSSCHQDRLISFGIIVPIIPVIIFSDDHDPWIHIENTSTDNPIKITRIIAKNQNLTSVTCVRADQDRYKYGSNTFQGMINQEIDLDIPAGEGMWLLLPDTSKIKLQLQMGDESISVTLKESTRLEWIYGCG